MSTVKVCLEDVPSFPSESPSIRAGKTATGHFKCGWFPLSTGVRAALMNESGQFWVTDRSSIGDALEEVQHNKSHSFIQQTPAGLIDAICLLGQAGQGQLTALNKLLEQPVEIIS